jgi:serine/threonine protein kinase
VEAPARIGRYHVLGPIARGGMAEVLRVKSVGLAGFEKVQALKRIAPAQAREPRFIRSFIDEARIAAELNHKNIVAVFDFGEVDGELYLTMELVDGLDLRAALDRGVAAGHPLPLPLACLVIAELAAGLDYAHRKADARGNPLGIVHCDISPANAMISRDGHVKILDFGIARASFAHAVERRRLRGKPRYMAPEQTHGERPTAATDVFALATVAWELLTGRPLFDGADVAATLAAVRSQPLVPIDRVVPAVPMAVARELDRALYRDPANRPTAIELARAATLGAAGATARTLAAWLDQVIAAVPAPPPSTLAAATADTITRAPLPLVVAATAPQRRGAPGWVDREASDAATAPFDHEATSTDLGVPWLDDDAAVAAIGTLEITDLIDATLDLPET